MDTAKLSKIQRLADDVRGDPKTREIARRILEANKPDPVRGSQYNQPHQGTRLTDEYTKFKFMDFSHWGKSKTGNLIHNTTIGGKHYKLVLFRHKMTPTYGWLRTETLNDNTVFSQDKFYTMAEAHKNAWDQLMKL
jgi:hypothetical protein